LCLDYLCVAVTKVLLGTNHSAAYLAVSRRYEFPSYTSNMKFKQYHHLPGKCTHIHPIVHHFTLTVHHFTPQYTTSLHNTPFHPTVHHFTQQYTTSPQNTPLHPTVHQFTTQYNTSPHSITLHPTIHHFTPRHTVSPNNTPFNQRVNIFFHNV